MVKLRCPNCRYVWEYRGRNPYYATCPRCSTKMRENGYRVLKCPSCSFEADRDTVAVLNIEMKALSKMGDL